MTRKRLLIVPVWLVCTLLLMVSFAEASEKVRLQLKWKHQFQFAGYYAAIEQGFYRDEGLDVSLIEGKPGQREVEEVLSGRAEYGVGMSDIVLSRLEGKPLVLVANIFQHSPVALITLKSSNINSPQELYQKKLRMTRGAKSAELQAMFLNEGVELSSLNIETPNWQLDDLISGEVDALAAYISSQPFELEKRSVSYTIISPKTYGIDFYGDNIFTAEQEVKNHPKRVQAFRRASLKGWAYALENRDEIIDLILSKYDNGERGLTREFLENEASVYERLILPRFVKLGHTNPGRWDHIASTYARLGLADEDYSLEGFFYKPQSKEFSWDHWSIKVFISVIAAAIAATVLLSLFNRRLRGEIESHRRTEKRLKESEEKFRALFEQAGGYCMILDPNTPDGIPLILDANRSACRMHGYEREEFVGRPVAMIDDEEGKKLVKARTAEIMTGKPFYVENEHLRKDGTTFSVAVNAIRIDLGDKPPLILTTEYDITEKKKAEKELIEREEQYRAIAENSGDCIVRYDRDGNHIYANDNVANITGLSKEQCIGKTFEEIGLPDQLCQLLKNNIEAVFTSGESRNFEFSLERNGREITHDLQLNPEFSDSGSVHTVIGVARDITIQRQLAERSRQSQKMETIGTLAGGIAHDFNNILSSVIGFTELAIESVDNKQPVDKEDLLEVYAAGVRARDLVKQILTFARQTDEKLEPLELGPIVREAIKFLRSTIPSTIEISHTIESGSQVKGNETQLHQIVMNLCNNAAQAMAVDGGALSIRVGDITIPPVPGGAAQPADLEPGSYVELTVEDTGPGMETHIVEKIFDPYFTTKDTGKGTGLGLAVVHGIVESYEGEILVESSIGKGTKFSVYLPACEEKRIEPPPDRSELPGGDERILLVDDEQAITRMNGRMLSQLGYKVTTKNSSIEALEHFKEQSQAIDLVISDVTMPQMTGDKLARELIAVRADIPVILCTGFNENVSKSSVEEIGVRELIGKPLVKSELAKIVRKVLDGR